MISAMSGVKYAGGVITETICSGEGITENTPFQAASISKMVFTIALLRFLAEQNIPLDTDVHSYCRKFVLHDLAGKPAGATIRQLLSHTAGVNAHGFLGYTDPACLPDTLQILRGESPANSEQVLQIAAPGKGWRYSGGGFMLLQEMVEEMTERSFPELADQLVLQPLGMKNSTFRIETGHIRGNPSELPESPCGSYFMPESAAAGLWTTPMDLMRFGMHMQSILSGEKGIVPFSYVREMVTPQCAFDLDMGYDITCKAGLGCFLKEIRGIQCFGHTGANVGFTAVADFSLEGQCGSCFMINSDFPEDYQKMFRRHLAGWEQ